MVYAHIILWFESSGINLSRSIIANRWIYSFHMPLMFMIAGYVHGMKDCRTKGYFYCLKKNFVNLYLPCMYFSLIQWCIMYFIFASRNPANFGAVTLSDLYTIPFNGLKEYWFLATLFFIKAMHSALECMSCRKILHSLFWIILFFLIKLYSNGLPSSVMHLSHGLYFHLGYIIRQNNYISQSRYPRLLWGIILFLMGLAFHFIPCIYEYNSFSTSTGTALCSCFGLFIIFYALNVNYSILVLDGLYSMVVYCLHNWITASFRMVFTISGMSANSDPVMMFAVSFAFAMILPLCVVWLYKNVKCFRWIEYIFYPGKLLLKR